MKYATLALGFAAVMAIISGAPAARAAEEPALTAPVKVVLEQYLVIQTNLATDTIKGLSEHAAAIAKAVNDDGAKTMPAEVAHEAQALGAAKDIKSAREAFKPLSASLAKYMTDHKAGKGTYHEVYCPMANANWLQTGKEIRNPYYGKEMLDCGEIKS